MQSLHESLEGKYEIFRTLGRGSFGEALLVANADSQIVVLKVMKCRDRQAVIEALQEMIMLKMARSPFIVEYINVFQLGQTVVSEMEFAEDGDLAIKIATQRQSNEFFPEQVPVFPETFSALSVDDTNTF